MCIRDRYNTDNGRGTGDELHVVVADATGDVTGYDADVAGNRTRSVIETFGNMSKNSSAKSPQGDSIYYPDVIFRQSKFIYWTDHISAGSNWGTDTTTTYTSVVPITIDTLTGETNPTQSFLPSTKFVICLLYTSPSPRDATLSRMPSSA